MSNEAELLGDFAATGSEAAFDGLIRLHTKLVFATAIRQIGDRGLAEEISQNVFLALASRAPSLRSDRTIAGWLYQTTINHARQRLRSELRRQNREQIAAAITEVAREGDSIWAMLIPLLDEALLSLGEKDRLAVILHYMERRTFREVGAALGVGEDAARKRVHRVVSDLSTWFRQRKITAPATALIAALCLPGVNTVNLSAASILALSGAGASVSASLPILGILMKSTQLKVAIALAALAIVGTTPLVLQHWRNQSTLPVEERPPTELTPALEKPSPSQRTTGLGTPVVSPPKPEKSFFERLNEGDMSLSMLSHDDADAFLTLNKTNAESLIAAYRVTHDLKYLRQTATNFPGDPSVLLRVNSHDAFPEDRRAWLEQFKKADPMNALAYYLSANIYWKENEPAAALRELAAAAQAPTFKDYVTDHMQTLEEIYLSSGHTPAEAKALATHAVELPHVAQAVDSSRKIADLIKQSRTVGDSASVENLARLGMGLAAHLNAIQDGGNLLGQMVGVAVEQRVLAELDPEAQYSFLTGPLAERRAQLTRRENEIRQDSQFIGDWIGGASEPEAVSYFDRLKLYGESAAIQWLKNRSAP